MLRRRDLHALFDEDWDQNSSAAFYLQQLQCVFEVAGTHGDDPNVGTVVMDDDRFPFHCRLDQLLLPPEPAFTAVARATVVAR